jgi:hypothetical protein
VILMPEDMERVPEALFPGTFIMPTAPGLQAMFGDPRLEGIKSQTEKERAVYESAEERFLQPADPPQATKSRYVLVQQDLESSRPVTIPVEVFKFVEEPNGYKDYSRWGGLALTSFAAGMRCAGHCAGTQRGHLFGAR